MENDLPMVDRLEQTLNSSFPLPAINSARRSDTMRQAFSGSTATSSGSTNKAIRTTATD